MEEFYDNGMVKLKDRIQEEFWYSDYQAVMQLITYNTYDSLGDFIRAAHKDIGEFRDIPQKMSIAIIRWCVLHWERKKHI